MQGSLNRLRTFALSFALLVALPVALPPFALPVALLPVSLLPVALAVALFLLCKIHQLLRQNLH